MSTAETVTSIDLEELVTEYRIAINSFIKKYVSKVVDDDDIDRFREQLEKHIKHYGVLKSKIKNGEDFEIPEISVVIDMDDADDDGQMDLDIQEDNEVTRELMMDIFSPDLEDEYKYKFNGPKNA